MKTLLKVASVLTWFNLIFWGLIAAFGILVMVLMGQLPYIAASVLLSAIPLNSYAGLKLHTSIRYPSVPLSHQTPVGIRFVGLMAVFLGLNVVYEGAAEIADPQPGVEAFKQLLARMPFPPRPGVAEMGKSFVLFGAVCWILLGVMVVISVVLNLRLLRWYYLVHRSDVS